MSLEFFGAWLAVMLPLVVSPGPANLLFAAAGAKQGVWRSLPLMAGIDSVALVSSLLVGFGLGQLLTAYPMVTAILKCMGIGYLFYLTWKFLTSHASSSKEPVQVYTFWDGFFVQLFNPKSWSVLLLMFSLFLTANEPSSFDVIKLVVMLSVLNIAAHLLWINMGAAIQRYLYATVWEYRVQMMFGVSLLLVAIWLLLDTMWGVLS